MEQPIAITKTCIQKRNDRDWGIKNAIPHESNEKKSQRPKPLAILKLESFLL